MMSSCTQAVAVWSLSFLSPLLVLAEQPRFTESREPFAVGEAVAQKRWVDGISPDNWQPVDQPELQQQLAAAKNLTLLDVAPAPQRVSQGHLPYFCPNPDGKSWDIVNPYHKNYLSEGQVLVHDFGSGESKMFSYGTASGQRVITPYSTDFHMKESFYLAQKMIFVLPTRGHGLVFLVYDPAVNDFVSNTTPFPGQFELFALDIGSDNRLYGIGLPDSRDGFQPFIFDPETYETTIFAPQGPGQQTPFPYYRGSAMYGDWMYCKYGHEPWHLIAYNFRTHEFRQLAATSEIKGDYKTIALTKHPGGISGHIREAARVEGVSTFPKGQFDFWLVDGKIVPRTNDTAPWSDEPVQRLRSPMHQFREFQRWPQEFTYDVPPPEIKPDCSGPIDPEGNVTLPYRLSQHEDWQSLTYQVKLYPGLVRRLIEVNPNTLFAVDEGYGQHIFYDIPGQRLKRYLVQRVSPYAVGVVSKRLYVSGYPLFVTVEYDLQNLAQTKAPQLLGSLGVESDTHMPLAGLTGGADGSVYIAGTTAGRRRDGGGMAWYNVESGKVGSQTMVDHRIFWLTAASAGRYVLLASKTDKGSRIFCWDTQRQQFIYDIPSPTGNHAGPLEEALPGQVIGHAADQEGGLLYGLDAATGKLLWRKPVPAGPTTAVAQVRRHAYTFRRGPDGFIWASFQGTLVRIDPRNANILPVGKMPDVQIAFAGGGVYAAGGTSLRKIADLRVEVIDK